jgi:hypothetical protein
MAYHLTHLGRYGETVREYADLDGYVPQEGDTAADMHYPTPLCHDLEDPEQWEVFLAAAIAATAEAEQAIAAWQQRSACRA